MFLIILLYAIFASTFTLGKAALAYTTPIFLVGIRMTIAGSIIMGYFMYIGNRLHFKRKNMWLYIQGMLFTVYIPYILRNLALKDLSASKASLLYNFGPFFSYILAYLMGREKVTWKKTTGLAIGFLGFIPALMEPAPLEKLVGGIGFISWSELAIIGSVSSLSYGWLVMHKLIKDKNYSPIMMNGFNMLVGGLLALVTSFTTETVVIRDQYSFWSILIVIVVVSNLICHNLYGLLLKKYTPTMLSFASFLTPMFTALYSWILFKEMVSWEFVVSSLIVFVGLGIFYSEELRVEEEAVHLEG